MIKKIPIRYLQEGFYSDNINNHMNKKKKRKKKKNLDYKFKQFFFEKNHFLLFVSL